MKIALGADHGGYRIKEAIKAYLTAQNIDFRDFGTFGEESVNYAEFARPVSTRVQSQEFDRGVLCCGTGIGMSIAANKFKGIRAAVCSTLFCAEMARRHNDANILCLGGRVIDEQMAIKLTKVFLDAPFEGGRHEQRLESVKKIETKE
jgi:ribose 5-phosphate isomerase B